MQSISFGRILTFNSIRPRVEHSSLYLNAQNYDNPAHFSHISQLTIRILGLDVPTLA
jgi:hypothetical protein